MRIEDIKRTYQNHDELLRKKQGKISRPTSLGFYVPTSLIHMQQAFTELLKEGIISKGQSFLDAGSGDGRILALAEHFGLAGYGIEYEADLVETSKESLCNLSCMSKIVQGDFLEDAPYKKLEKAFSSFDIIFNFINNCNELAQRILIEEFHPLYLVYDTSSLAPHWEGLEKIKTLILRDEKAISEYDHEKKYDDLPQLIGYLHVFKK